MLKKLHVKKLLVKCRITELHCEIPDDLFNLKRNFTAEIMDYKYKSYNLDSKYGNN